MTGARGRGVPAQYKTSMTWADGWRAGMIGFYVGARAAEKARLFADEAIQRARRKLSKAWVPPTTSTCASKSSVMKVTGAKPPVM